MGFGVRPSSPFVARDREDGNITMSVSIPYDDDFHGGTHAITGDATFYRVPGATRAAFVVGHPLEPDHVVDIPEGTSFLPLEEIGLTNIDQILIGQYTFA